MKRRVRIGFAFDDVEAEVVDSAGTAKEKSNLVDGVVRERLVRSVSLVGVTALAIATYLGWDERVFDELKYVWSVVGPIFGMVFSYYFNKAKQLDDES